MMIAVFLLLLCIMVLQFVIIRLKLKETNYQMSMHNDVMKELSDHKKVFVDHVEDKNESIGLKRDILQHISRMEPDVKKTSDLVTEIWKDTFTPLTNKEEYEEVVAEMDKFPSVVEVDIHDERDEADLHLVEQLDQTKMSMTIETEEEDAKGK